jgi:hypothetical protein
MNAQTKWQSVGVVILGAIIFYLLLALTAHAELEYERTRINPGLFARLAWLWMLLCLALPGLIVGLAAIRRGPILSGTAYFLGILPDVALHPPQTSILVPTLRQAWIRSGIELIFLVIVGVGVGWIGSRVRNHLTGVGADREE